MQANFVQITRSPTMGTEEEQRGRLVLKRPNKMRWDFTRPDKRLFVTDGQQMWIHSPEDNQVIHYQDLSGVASGGIDSLLSEMDKLGESYNVVLDTDPKAARIGHFALRLTPKGEAPFKTLFLEVHKRKHTHKLSLKRILLIDTFDNETELRLSGVKVNGNVPDSQFQFQVPSGAELIQPDAL
jgi:outer membrane lipoprotein carrier protein